MKTKAFPIAWKRLFDYNKLIHRMHPDCLQAGDHSMRVVQQLLIRMTLDLVKAQLMVQVKLLIA